MATMYEVTMTIDGERITVAPKTDQMWRAIQVCTICRALKMSVPLKVLLYIQQHRRD